MKYRKGIVVLLGVSMVLWAGWHTNDRKIITPRYPAGQPYLRGDVRTSPKTPPHHSEVAPQKIAGNGTFKAQALRTFLVENETLGRLQRPEGCLIGFLYIPIANTSDAPMNLIAITAPSYKTPKPH